MLEHIVAMPLGTVRVGLDRRGLELGERGGFEASWAEADASLSPEAYRDIVKAHLKEVYTARNGREPSAITLNLASHQLLDDLTGWTRLNDKPRKLA